MTRASWLVGSVLADDRSEFRPESSFGGAALQPIAAPSFDLNLTLECGQVFHWQRSGAGWRGAIDELAVYVEQRGETLLVPAGTEEAVRHYFALDHPLEEIYASFPSDHHLESALQLCRGLRIIRQPRWECLATFITSSMKQVAHISQMSEALRRRFGRPLESFEKPCFAYPSAARIAHATEAELRACSLGYRAKNLLATARQVASGEFDLDGTAHLDDDVARAELCRLPGVGEKVANCVLLFAYERLRAFPIDVWIERVLRELYFAGKRRVTNQRLRAFTRSHFGPYGGYAQQYLFHYARKTRVRFRERELEAKSRRQRTKSGTGNAFKAPSAAALSS